MTDVANMFAEYSEKFQISTSRFVAGLIVLGKFQVAQEEYITRTKKDGVQCILSSIPIKADTQFLDISNPEDSHLLNDLIYFMNYSLAVFGWQMNLYEDIWSVFSLLPHMRWCSCCTCSQRRARPAQQGEKQKSEERVKAQDDRKSKQQVADLGENSESHSRRPNQPKDRPVGVLEEDHSEPIVIGDNCFSCSLGALEHRFEEHNIELIYLNLHSEVGKVPFLVVADHTKQTIVVSVRGSMATSDVINDFNGFTEPVPIENCPEDWICHRGMRTISVYIYNKLMDEKILDRAFNCRPEWNSNQYNLLLCGQSLGAGVASILGIQLRQIYPNLRAFLYSPPGGMLSMPVVEYTKEFAVSVVLGNDFIARLGMAQMERLRYQVLLALRSSNKPTRNVLARALFPECCLGQEEVEYDPEKSLDLLTSTSGKPFMYGKYEIRFQESQCLYLPGRIIHIVRNYNYQLPKSSTHTNKSREPIYQAIWSKDNSIYDRLMIKEGAILDHMPNNLMHSLKMLFCHTMPSGQSSNPRARVDAGVGGGSHVEKSEVVNDGKDSIEKSSIPNDNPQEEKSGSLESEFREFVSDSREMDVYHDSEVIPDRSDLYPNLKGQSVSKGSNQSDKSSVSSDESPSSKDK